METPEGVCIAFAANSLDPTPSWVRLATARVASWTIDRGRSFELDRIDAGTAKVVINDLDGRFDPLNALGPHYGELEPLKQAAIALQDPKTGDWSTLFSGFIEDYDYSLDPSQQVMRLTLSLVDAFAVLSAVEMMPDGTFGDPAPPGTEGDIFFDDAGVDDRIIQALGNALWPTEWQRVFSGNVEVQETVYSPGETILTVIQDAADAEFPGVANVYTDKSGHVCFHGRMARFDPAAVSFGTSWDFHHWKCGDGNAVVVSPTDTAQIRGLAFNRGLSRIVNYAMATPQGIADSAIPGQVVTAATSIGKFGRRSWTAQALLTKGGKVTNPDDPLAETLLFADYYVQNYAAPRNRISQLVFRPLSPDDPRAGPLWRLICGVELSDLIDVTVTNPGGGSFDEAFFVEGIHYDVKPLSGVTADGYELLDVTLTLEVSPQTYFDNPTFG